MRAPDTTKKSEKISRSFFNLLRDAVIFVNYDREILDCNPAFSELFGYTKDEIKGKTAAFLFPSHEEFLNLGKLMKELRDETNFIYRGYYQKKSGEIFFGENSIQYTKSDDREPNGFIGLIRDISERKTKEDALMQSQSLLNTMGRIAKIGAWKTNSETRLLQGTEELHSIYEIESSFRLDLDTLIEFYTPDSRQVLQQSIGNTMATGKPFDIELELYTAKGSHKWVRAIGNAGYEGGKITHRVGITQDITERKKQDAALRESENRFRRLAENAQDLIYRMSLPDGTYEYVSPASYKITGYTPDVYYSGKIHFTDIVHPDFREYFEAQWKNLLIGKMPPFYEYKIIHKEGGSRFIHQRNVLVLDKNGNPAAIEGIVTDITELKEAEEKIKALLSEKELLLKEAHHRIKNNMNNMMSLLALQAHRIQDPAVVSSLKEAESRFRSMGILYDRLYRTDNMREMSVKDYLPALVQEIVRLFPCDAAVQINLKVDDFLLGVKVLSSLGIILNELLTNSLKYAFIGKAQGSVSVTVEKAENRVTVVAADDGIGIPASVDIGTSTGFGLVLVGTMTKQLAGKIRIDRSEGTRFVLEFEA